MHVIVRLSYDNWESKPEFYTVILQYFNKSFEFYHSMNVQLESSIMSPSRIIGNAHKRIMRSSKCGEIKIFTKCFAKAMNTTLSIILYSTYIPEKYSAHIHVMI